jgi:hypothetical protein
MKQREIMAVGSAAFTAARGQTAAQGKARGVRFGVRSPLPKATFREKALLVKRLGYDGIEIGEGSDQIDQRSQT